MEVIRTEDLSKTYTSGLRRVKALCGLSLSVEKGEIFGFLGPNAAGKTTTIKILMHLTFPSGGRAWVLGERTGSREVKERVGYLPENPSFYPNLTGSELLDFYSRLFGKSGGRRGQIERLLGSVGLENAGGLKVGNYSKGMLQRIGIAQSLINDPELVVLDEPLAGVDPAGRKSLRDLILHLKERGKTIFFSTHILQDVELICDRVAILIKGSLVSVGRLDEILDEEVESIEVTVRNLAPDVAESIGKSAVNVIGSSDRSMIIVKDEESLEKVQAAIQHHRGMIVSIIPRRRTLEEHFMEKTKE